MISIRHAQAAAIAKYGDHDAMQRAIEDADLKKEVEHQRKTSMRTTNPENTGQASRALITAASLMADPIDRYRFMGSTPMPWLSRSREAQNGIWCLGCYESMRSFVSHMIHPGDDDSFQEGEEARMKIDRRLRRAFDRDEFLEHVRNCTGAKRWAKRRQMSVVVLDPS